VKKNSDAKFWRGKDKHRPVSGDFEQLFNDRSLNQHVVINLLMMVIVVMVRGDERTICYEVTTGFK
jgi:hypothetical protein